jgi:hypothetical protein
LAAAGGDQRFHAELAHGFESLLNEHGHGFQYAVIHKLNEIFRKQNRWLFEVAEFPVATLRFDTKIDFIIRPVRTRFFLVAECKRANPALKDWCFLRAPMIARGRRGKSLLVEHLVTTYTEVSGIHPSRCFADCFASSESIDAFHIGFELRNHREKGDGHSSGAGRKTIEEVSGQVFKAVNGLAMAVSRMSRDPDRPTQDQFQTWLMPAIFTTANLWVTDANLSDAEITTGDLPRGSLTLRPVNWLYYQYSQSPSLKHSLQTPPLGFEFSEMLEPEYMRTIAVINPAGIEDFFSRFIPEDFTPRAAH